MCSAANDRTASPLPLLGKVSLVTGASRGIGAATAVKLAQLGSDVVINYRSKSTRADAVVKDVELIGRFALPVRADLTVHSEVAAMMTSIRERFGRLDMLILNASGGMEKGKPEDYAMALNVTAQQQTAAMAIQLMPERGRVVFVTSHWAHFYGQRPVMPEYEAVASSKNLGEKLLRSMVKDGQTNGLSLIVVSGDMIEGTITPRLLERQNSQLKDQRRAGIRVLPTVDEFAGVIAAAAADPSLPNGHTIFVGSTEL